MAAEERLPDYGRLCGYLCDMVLEEQLKLGYERETIRFYLPCSSVAHILGIAERDGREVLPALSGFLSYAKDSLGDVRVSLSEGDRICFRIPAEGAAYVHEKLEAPPFLRELVACFAGHDVTPERVCALFSRWSAHVRCESADWEGVDLVFYFEDGIPDEFRYCVTFDEGHASYHRYLREDYEGLLGEESVGRDEA